MPGRILLTVAAMAVIGVGSPRAIAMAQARDCRSVERMMLAAEPDAPDPELVDWLAEATQNVAAERRRSGLMPVGRWPLPPLLTDSIRRRAIWDRKAHAEIAWVLVMMMMAPQSGFSTDQASVAAELYAELELPTQPAAWLLGNARSSAHEKLAALRAVFYSPLDSTLADAVVSSLCLLAWQSAGVEQALGPLPDSVGSYLGLTTEERDLLGKLLLAIDRWRTEPGSRRSLIGRLGTFLPHGLPVARYLARHSSLW